MIPKIQLDYYNKNVQFGTCKPNRKISVICDNGKEIVVDKLIRKESNKTSVLENVKHIFFELFPKFDPEYKSLFGHLDKRV